MKIQERCCHGFKASSCSQRQIVDADASVSPRWMTSRCSSLREKRLSGSPCVAGSSQASAFGVMAAVGGMPQAGMAAASPTVAIVAPADSSTVSGTVTVTADVQSDTPIAAVTLEVDGRILASFTAATQYSSQLDTTVLADGDHVLGATAVDAHGVVSTAAAHVVVDNPRSASLV